jgi:excisionase family DNA binding protein
MSTAHNTMRGRTRLVRKEVFSLREAADYLGVSASTVRRRIVAGALRAQRWGRRWILWRADLDQYCTRMDAPGKVTRPLTPVSWA